MDREQPLSFPALEPRLQEIKEGGSQVLTGSSGERGFGGLHGGKEGCIAYNQEGDTGGCTERWNQGPGETEDRAGLRKERTRNRLRKGGLQRDRDGHQNTLSPVWAAEPSWVQGHLIRVRTGLQG